MTFLFHAAISPSPVRKAFPFIEWNGPIAVSRPEQTLLQSAEANPLEYILAEYDDAFAYARLLLKVLDQVTGPSNPGRVSELSLDASTNATIAGQQQQQQQGGSSSLEEETALQYLEDDKTGVVTHYMITQLYEMMGLLTERPAHSPVQISTLFYKDDKLLEDWRPLLRLLYRPGDPFSQRGAALCLMYILRAGCREEGGSITKNKNSNASKQKIPMVEETLQSLVSWLTSRLQSSHSTFGVGVVTPTLVVLGTCPTARIIFDNAGGIGYLARHLRPKTGGSLTAAGGRRKQTNASNNRSASPNATRLRRPSSSTSIEPPASPNTRSSLTRSTTTNSSSSNSTSMYSTVSVQQLYELCFCLWTMTYECEHNERIRHHFARDGAVAALADLIAAAPREKVVRLALSSLRHLAQVAPALFVPEMIACRVLKSVNLLKEQRKWSDPDVLEDLEILHQILTESYKELTKWEVYQAELDSGQLKWGILHSEQFFKANARKMEGTKGDFCHVKRLIQLVTNIEHDEETVAIACFDLGEFIRQYPNGKSIAKRLGCKEVIMPLLSHESLEIQRHALQCISKLLVNNWEAAIRNSAS